MRYPGLAYCVDPQMSVVSGGKLSAHLGVAASAHKARRLDVTIECYWQSAEGLSVLLEPSRMGRERGGRGREKRQMGVQSLKLMSLLCAGRRQLLSEFTVFQRRPAQTPSPPSSSSQTRLCLWCMFQVFVLLSHSADVDCTVEGKIPQIEFTLCYSKDFGW